MENQERQTNYTIAEGFRLPSKGQIYDVAVNPIVELRAMTGRDELKRTNPTATQFKLLADLIEGCMLEKPKVHVYDMALGDYNFLLHRLRVVSYGDAYRVSLLCPFCGNIIDSEIHLDSLQPKEFDLNKFNELRTFKLPDCGKVVTIKFQTPRMLDDIDNKVKELKRKYKTADTNFERLTVLSTIIDNVDGEKLDPVKIETFVNSISAKDLIKIENSLDALNASIGLDTETQVVCKSCGGDVPTSFRFGPEFLRPTNI